MNAELVHEVHADAGAAAQRCATLIAEQARAAMAARGRFVMALSGGSTPAAMFRHLAQEAIDWSHVFIAQTDERVAPVGSQHRNLTQLRAALVDAIPIPREQVLAMRVERADLAAAARHYQRRLGLAAGVPVVFDLVHLGLGEDGHTASLLPGDAALDVVDADVALTGEYQGWPRMTLTLPAINRARAILWLVTGQQKSAVATRLLAQDNALPASRVERGRALLLMDREAAGGMR